MKRNEITDEIINVPNLLIFVVDKINCERINEKKKESDYNIEPSFISLLSNVEKFNYSRITEMIRNRALTKSSKYLSFSKFGSADKMICERIIGKR